MAFQVTCETTPNPQSLKFVLNVPICDETLEISDRTKAGRSPLAGKILGFPWAKSVFLGKNFVTVTKEDWLEWGMIQGPLSDLIQEHLERGEKALLPKKTELKKALKSSASESSAGESSPASKKIKEILERDIQPAVAMDGGFIEFVSYKNGIVYLSLQGACSGCPSSSYTLKQGIETRLKQFLPEIQSVEEV